MNRKLWIGSTAGLLALGGAALVAEGVEMDVKRKFEAEIGGLGLPTGPGPADLVTADEITSHPPVVQRYLEFMRVVGQPRIWSFRATFRGRFRMKPDHEYQRVEAHQYSTRLAHARIFHMQLKVLGLPVYGRDVYMNGGGRMLIRPLDLFTLQDGVGEEFAIGELVTYLNDGILIAPSILVGDPAVTWTEVDDRTFEVAIADGGRTVKARVFLDERGAPVDFETTDRFGDDPFAGQKLVRTRWTTPVSGWQEDGGRPLPGTIKAVWHFPGGDFTYGEFDEPAEIRFNVAPGA